VVCICFQANFFPDLIHVSVLPDTTVVMPAIVHAPPTFTAAYAGFNGRAKESESIDKNAISLLFTYRE